jgi:hypothetical protein
MTTIFWHVADWHVNNKMGVRIPNMILDEEEKSSASPGQRFLWRSLLDQQQIILKKKRQYKAKEVWAGLGGDMGELDTKHRTDELHSHNESTVLEMIVNTLKPVTDISKHLFVAKGTDAHVGYIEELLANDLETEIHPDTTKRYGHKWLINCGGINIMFQHHGSLGRLKWTKANALNKKAVNLMLQYGKKCPDIFIQAHNHRFATCDNSYPVLVIAAPCMKLPGDFEARIDVDDADYGGLYFVCDRGKILEWDVMLYEPREIRKWSQK